MNTLRKQDAGRTANLIGLMHLLVIVAGRLKRQVDISVQGIALAAALGGASGALQSPWLRPVLGKLALPFIRL